MDAGLHGSTLDGVGRIPYSHLIIWVSASLARQSAMGLVRFFVGMEWMRVADGGEPGRRMPQDGGVQCCFDCS